MVALIVLWGVIVSRLTDGIILDCALMLAGTIATAVYVWWMKRTHDLAASNPGVALLEGAELLEFRRFDAQAKGILPSTEQPSVHQAAGARSDQQGQERDRNDQ